MNLWMGMLWLVGFLLILEFALLAIDKLVRLSQNIPIPNSEEE